MFASAAPMQLYLASRVKRHEKNKRFKEWIEKSKAKREKLSKKLKKVNDKKRQELIDYINSLEIKIPKMSLKKLRKKAVKHYNWLWNIERRNFEMFGKVGKNEGYTLLKKRINEEIFKIYPELRDY